MFLLFEHKTQTKRNNNNKKNHTLQYQTEILPN